MPVPVRRAAGEWRSVMGTRPGVQLYLSKRVTVGEPWLPLEQQIQITWRL